MWCSTCQQDVPGLGSSSSGRLLRCSKCGNDLASATRRADCEHDDQRAASATFADNAALEKLLRSSPLSDEDWALEAELRGVQRLLGTMKSRSASAADTVVAHPPHPTAATWHAAPPPSAPEPTNSNSPRIAPPPRSHTAAWTILSLGLATFACGAVLLGWSLATGREDLWPVGMPLALIGQAGLILGLILQLDGLWHTSRTTAAALSELDGELKNVRQATTLLSTSHSGGAQSFYLHLAEGATPQLLLADLKGQMDLLAQQMARK